LQIINILKNLVIDLKTPKSVKIRTGSSGASTHGDSISQIDFDSIRWSLRFPSLHLQVPFHSTSIHIFPTQWGSRP